MTRDRARIITVFMGAVLFGVMIFGHGGTVGMIFDPHRKAAEKEVEKQHTDFYAHEVLNFEKAMRVRGAEKVLDDFRLENTQRSLLVQHMRAHLFGEALWNVLGKNGIAICDDSFEFGCFHGFLARAIAIEGLSAVSELDGNCRKLGGAMSLACEHGLGHGIMGAFGTDETAFKKSLDVCSVSAEALLSVGGCASGVVMEYYFHTVHDNGKSFVKKADGGLYAVCATAPESLRPACYFETPHWWAAVVGGDMAKNIALCRVIENRSDRTACIQGFGNVAAPLAAYDAGGVIRRCGQMAVGDEEELCREGAVLMLASTPERKKHIGELCVGLKSDLEHRCQEWIRRVMSL